MFMISLKDRWKSWKFFDKKLAIMQIIVPFDINKHKFQPT